MQDRTKRTPMGLQLKAGLREVALSDILSFSNGSASPMRSDESPIPVYGSNGVIGHSDETNSGGNVVVIGRVGSYCGSLHFSESPCWVTDNAIRASPVGETDARFTYYLLHTLNLNEWRTGSGQPLLNQAILSSIPAIVPPLSEQQSIARVLATLDDKIELNRRMNETLETMARALFKSWFVDFEPVRAKMEGRWRPGESLPGLPAELYDLFPDRLAPSELGEVPEGWEVRNLGYCLALLETGRRPQGGVSGIIEGIPSVGAESIERVGIFDFNKTKYVPSEFYREMRRGVVQDGDVLIYKDGGKPGELEPSVTYVSQGFPFNVFCINEHVFRARARLFSQPLLYCYLTTPSVFWQMRELATGVAQPGLNRRAFESIAITIPTDSSVLSACQERIGPLLEECNVNSLESQALATQRDVLLPKLMTEVLGTYERT